MKEIIDIVNKFSELEREAISEYHVQNVKNLNQKLKEMNSLTTRELHYSFGMIHREKPDKDILADYKEDPPEAPIKRYLYKINKYQNATYGEMYGAYVSSANPWMKEMGEILVVTRLEDQLKIITRLHYGSGPNGNQGWAFLQDDGGLKLTDFKNPLEVLKIMPPEDIDGIELYKKDDL